MKLKVFRDKMHTYVREIKLLDYDHCEEMKSFWDSEGTFETSILTHYAHYHRFLQSMNKDAVPGPSFEEYIEWKQKYKGWSYGPFTPRHSAWKGYAHQEGETFPMNAYYEGRKE